VGETVYSQRDKRGQAAHSGDSDSDNSDQGALHQVLLSAYAAPLRSLQAVYHENALHKR
jgi:hypothetical protein